MENLPQADAAASCPVLEEASDTGGAARQAQIGELIDQWVMERIHNSPVALVTAAYNHLITALDDLKHRLQKGF